MAVMVVEEMIMMMMYRWDRWGYCGKVITVGSLGAGTLGRAYQSLRCQNLALKYAVFVGYALILMGKLGSLRFC